MSKGTTIISDLRSFFSENENNRAINSIMRVMECINIRPSQIGTEKKDNCKYTNVQVLNLLMLFPFFVVRNVYRYSGSSLSRLFCCEKDMFYRTANQIVAKLQKQGLTKHSRTLKCTYCTIDVKFAGTTVRLFFSKRGRKGQWNGLLTTDLALSFLKAYRTYATRWTTEVAYRDCKQLLGFGKCQSVHFTAQIASFTLTMMQYNVLCTVKRFEAYETLGALFRETTAGTLELSAAEKIWELILDTILEIAEIISADASELLSAVIDENPKFHKLYQM